MPHPFLRTAALLAVTFSTGPALAHGGHAEGFAAGVAHPVLGLDHLVAMVAVGLWAALAQARAVPVAFLAGMALGIGAGLVAPAPGWIEHGVAGSVLALGLILVLAVPMRAGLALAAAAAFGLMHGLAHGGEIGGAAIATATGMLLASAALHGAGFALGRFAADRVLVARTGGAGIAALGAALLVIG